MDKKKLYSILPDTTGCNWIKKMYSKLGEGVQGSVYEICCENNTSHPHLNGCQYVVKHIQRKTSQDIKEFINMVKHEVNLQTSFANLGFAPRVLTSYSSNVDAYIIMDKVDTNLKSYMNSLLLDKKISDDSILQEISHIERDTIDIVKRSYLNFLVHNDLHPENIGLMVDKLGRYIYPMLIDFGTGFKQFTLDDTQFEKIIKGVKETFDAFRRKVKERTILQTKSKSPPKAPKKEVRRYTEDDEEEQTSSSSFRKLQF